MSMKFTVRVVKVPSWFQMPCIACEITGQDGRAICVVNATSGLGLAACPDHTEATEKVLRTLRSYELVGLRASFVTAGLTAEPHLMTTNRLDRLAATGTSGRIHLADGHRITVTDFDAGAAEFREVFLFPGLDAPDGDAWEREDAWEEWLTGGELGAGGGRLFLEVPVEAVRALIEEHGGEHPEQDD